MVNRALVANRSSQAIDHFAALDRLIHRRVTADVAFNELQIQACQVHLVAREEIVENPDFVAFVKKLPGEVRPNESGSACDKRFHARSL